MHTSKQIHIIKDNEIVRISFDEIEAERIRLDKRNRYGLGLINSFTSNMTLDDFANHFTNKLIPDFDKWVFKIHYDHNGVTIHKIPLSKSYMFIYDIAGENQIIKNEIIKLLEL